MTFKIIPPEERHKYRCCLCCETRSVKYLIPTYNPLEGEGFYDLPYCDKCASWFIGEVINEKEEQKNESI